MSSKKSAETPKPLQRGRIYGFFAAAMEYPEGELAGLIRSGEIARQARQLVCGVYPELESEIDWKALADAGKDDELSIEYTRLFDVGGSDGPPCSLNSGSANSDARMQHLEELVRFYNYFGLTAGETEANELPDHLTTQFEFMYYLCHQEAECQEAGEEADDYQRAQRDFLKRHPGQWVPNLNLQLDESFAPPFYLALGQLMHRFIQLEQKHIGSIVSQLKEPEPHAPVVEETAAQKKSKVIPITQVQM
jgi:DMSO reductase family type II enzyme chaperone